MLHDHACIGPEATYCAAIAIGLGIAALILGLMAGMCAARALARLWRRLGKAEDAQRVRF